MALTPHSTPDQGTAPPRLPFVFGVGVTGHRSDALPDALAAALAERIEESLTLLKSRVLSLHASASSVFSAEPPRLLLMSPLADGADQIVAEIALKLGFTLQAILPSSRDFYPISLPDEPSRRRFERLVERASCVLELPGDAGTRPDGFVMTGRATVAHCDVLMAVWDGLPARGRGGTADVVQLAITRGTPVIHLPTDPNVAVRMLWSAFDPAVVTAGDERGAERPATAANLDLLLTGLLLPPGDAQEQSFLAQFHQERLHRVRARIEYPLLLAAAGVGRVGVKDITEKHAERHTQNEWARFREECGQACPITANIDRLELAYGRADRLATHFAQTYRSGHIFNFVLGGLAVCLGLSAFMAPDHRLGFAATEILITLAIILNAHIGSRNEWHRRWLDYRQLAERLRPMRSLKLLGIAAPDPPGTDTNPVPRRWIDWYASAAWRAMGCPTGQIESGRAPRLASAIAQHEVAPQVEYHERNSRLISMLDRRLSLIGTLLFVATLAVSVATVAGLALGAAWVEAYGEWFTLISAGFPALGTALFGIRFQADFGGDAVRSLGTANVLKQIERELRSDASLSRAADLTEQAGRVMLGNLDEWRLINQQRDLSIG